MGHGIEINWMKSSLHFQKWTYLCYDRGRDQNICNVVICGDIISRRINGCNVEDFSTFSYFFLIFPYICQYPSLYSWNSTLHVTSRFSIPFMWVSLHNTQRHPHYCKIHLHANVGIPQSYCLVHLNNTADHHLPRSSPHFRVSNHVTDDTLLKKYPQNYRQKSLQIAAKVPPYYWTLSTRLEKSFQITKQSPYFWAYISRVLRWYNHLQLVFIFEFIVVYFSYSSYFVRKNS